MRLDATNLRLLQLLVDDGRASVAHLAAAVGRSESAVRERLAALEAGHVLLGYTARFDWQRLGVAVRAQVRGRCDLRRLPAVVRQLQDVPEVTQVRLTTGQRPLLLDVCTTDTVALERLLATKIAPLELEAVEVELALQVPLEPRQPAMAAGRADAGDARSNGGPVAPGSRQRRYVEGRERRAKSA